MEELTLTEQEQGRLHVMNLVLEGRIELKEAANIMVISERQAWRILKAYRELGASALTHGNRRRRPPNAIPEEQRREVIHFHVLIDRPVYFDLIHRFWNVALTFQTAG